MKNEELYSIINEIEYQIMTNEITVTIAEELSPVVKSSGLEKAQVYAAKYSPFILKVRELAEKIETINQSEPTAIDMKIARECRLALVKNRTATGKQKDADKANILAEGNLIQALHNVVVNKSILIESDFEAVEKVAEIKEAKRKEQLKIDRTAALDQFGIDLTAYNLAEMTDETFANLLESQQLLKAEREAWAVNQEAERIEQERLQAVAREAQRIENERLKLEVAAAKVESDRLAKENADRLAAIETANKEKDAAAAAEIKKAQDIAFKLAAEIKAQKEDEVKKEAESQAKIKAAQLAADKAAKAPVKQKMRIWVESITLPSSPVDNDIATEISNKFAAFKTWATAQIESL